MRGSGGKPGIHPCLRRGRHFVGHSLTRTGVAARLRQFDEKVKRCGVSRLALPTWQRYYKGMTSFARSLLVLLIAVFMAGTFVLVAPVAKAETAVTLAAMPMGTALQDCPKCVSQSDMAAGCDLSCALSVVAILVGPVTPAGAVMPCRFDLANATVTGQVPSPAFMPPRTVSLI